MTYTIECYIETIGSEGNFTVHGTEGCCQEKGGKIYNILWPEDSSNTSVECFLSEQKFKLPEDDSPKEILLLISAKTNRSKVKLIFDKASKKNFTLKSISLI